MSVSDSVGREVIGNVTEIESGERSFDWRWELAKIGLIVLFYLMAAPFFVHAIELVVAVIDGEISKKPYLFISGGTVGNTAMAVHIAAGVFLTACVPLQLVAIIRKRMNILHRLTGYALAGLGCVTAAAGLIYIALRGTIGGTMMSVGFTLYGACLLVAAVRMLQTAISQDRKRHGEWALRFFVLAIGSWLYRLHYVLWYIATGGIWSNPEFTGAFDKVQNFAFFLPYLAAVEVWIIYRSSKMPRPVRG